MMYFVKVYITYKDSVLDPQGEAVKKAVHRMGYETIEDIRIGKYFEIQLADTEEPIDTVIETICEMRCDCSVFYNHGRSDSFC